MNKNKIRRIEAMFFKKKKLLREAHYCCTLVKNDYPCILKYFLSSNCKLLFLVSEKLWWGSSWRPFHSCIRGTHDWLSGIRSSHCHSTEHVNVGRIVKTRVQTLQKTTLSISTCLFFMNMCIYTRVFIFVNVNLCGSVEGFYSSGISLNVK